MEAAVVDRPPSPKHVEHAALDWLRPRLAGGAGAAAIIIVTDVGLGAYDADNNEVIDRDEALAAVAAYLQGVISKEEALAVIKLYFAS